ncbi:uncharacterized protein LOC128724643 [Anopheles nili]|uniref:uncharacterized protein LOC128724643 n=1 Tax=Anopheles nili TaxID=185578 RepID=UPI00237BF73D|nr:uncharacterized protein LOC128724643 [Anopheles nili]
MSTSTRFRFHTLLVMIVIGAIVGRQHARAAILTRAIEAQKSLVEREEQALQEAKDQMYRTAQNALDASRGAVSNVAEQLRYAVMYPLRVANEALEKPKLYARYMLSKAPFLNSGDETTSAPVVLGDETVPQESDGANEMLPQLMSGLRLLFNQDTTEPTSNLPKPSPLIEIIEIKASPAAEITPDQPVVEFDKEQPKEVIVI